MAMSWRHLIVGSPLRTADQAHQRLTKTKALAIFSSDALSSVAYATEEILLVLVAAGTAALSLSMPIALTITGLLVIVVMSYYQTIHGYPSGGGSYIVAHENLGVWPGLVAAAALLIDYVLTVAVSITAGIVAIISAAPELLPWRVHLCLLAILLIVWGNLRGVRESGTMFAIPTYAFLLLFLALILAGLIRLATGSLSAVTAPPLPAGAGGSETLAMLLVLRAFASGCTAMTGVEAISNGVQAFQKPEADNAGKTLIVMAVLLAAMFLGITFLARALGIVPVEQESVVSQIARQVFGSGPLYLALQGATALILVLAANTAFADFPRLSSILARDGYAPRQLANMGDRLVFSNGIAALAVLAAALVIIFSGQTHGLIPLYAVGVFLAFTLSQAGMVRHWHKTHERGWRVKAAINGLGAVATGVVLCVVVESKVTQGAWIIVLLIPALVVMFRAVHQHYLDMREQVLLQDGEMGQWAHLGAAKPHKVVVPLASLNRAALAALRFSRSLSDDVTAVVVDVDTAATARLSESWEAWGFDIPLVVLESPYRSVVRPLLAYLEATDQREPERGAAVVILPEIVPARWWQHLLHNQTTLLLKTVLLFRQERNGAPRVVINVPYHLRSYGDGMTHLLDVFLHLDVYLDSVIQQYGVWMYCILFVVVFLETGVVVTPFLPGDSLLFAAGALSARGDLAVGWLFMLLFLAAVLGDTVNYSIGRLVGPRAFHGQNRLFKREHLDRTHQFYERHGGKAIVLARFIPIIRTFAPFVAGIGRMSYGRFVMYNVLGALLWTVLFIFGGYYFGNQPLVKRNFKLVILAIIGLSLLPLVVEFVQNYRRKARSARSQPPSEKVA